MINKIKLSKGSDPRPVGSSLVFYGMDKGKRLISTAPPSAEFYDYWVAFEFEFPETDTEKFEELLVQLQEEHSSEDFNPKAVENTLSGMLALVRNSMEEEVS